MLKVYFTGMSEKIIRESTKDMDPRFALIV